MDTAGSNCDSHYILAAALGSGEKRASVHSSVYAIITNHNCHHFCNFVEGEALLGKVQP